MTSEHPIQSNDPHGDSYALHCAPHWGRKIVLTGFLILLVVLIILTSVISPVMGILWLIGLISALIIPSATRVHGLIVLAGLGILVGIILCDRYFQIVPLTGFSRGLMLFTLQFLPQGLTFFLTLASYLIVPFLLLESLYWTLHTRNWWLITSVVLLTIFADGSGTLYTRYNKKNFEAAYALKGQTLHEEEFQKACGKPAWYTPPFTPDNPKGQWCYSDAKREIPVIVNGDGTVTVNDYAYPFLDS